MQRLIHPDTGAVLEHETGIAGLTTLMVELGYWKTLEGVDKEVPMNGPSAIRAISGVDAARQKCSDPGTSAGAS